MRDGSEGKSAARFEDDRDLDSVRAWMLKLLKKNNAKVLKEYESQLENYLEVGLPWL